MKKEAVYGGGARWFSLERCLWALIPNRQSVLVLRNYADLGDSGLNRNDATTRIGRLVALLHKLSKITRSRLIPLSERLRLVKPWNAPFVEQGMIEYH